MKFAASILTILLAACASDPTAPTCEVTAVESWPRIVSHENPDSTAIVQDTTALSCTVGDPVGRSGLDIGTCICID